VKQAGLSGLVSVFCGGGLPLVFKQWGSKVKKQQQKIWGRL